MPVENDNNDDGYYLLAASRWNLHIKYSCVSPKLGGRCFYLHVSDERIESQRAQVICLRSHS